MRNFAQLTLIFSGLILFAQCTPKYGAYFKNTPIENSSLQTKQYLTDNKNVPELTNVEESGSLSASTSTTPDLETYNVTYSSSTVVTSSQTEITSSVPEVESPVSNEEQKLSKKQFKSNKKKLKKELKKELKQSGVRNQKIWIGIVVASAGILISILTSSAIGPIAIVVGIGFIAWGLIEQGTI